MTLEDLKTISALIRRGTMSGAAAELHTVQSNITGRIRALELELKTELFIRSTRGVRPTPAGQRLSSYANRILLLVQEACASVQENKEPEGPLRIGAMEVTVSIRIPDLVTEYLSTYPAVQLTVSAGTSDQMVAQVLQRDIDGCFAIGILPHKELVIEPLFQDELCLITSEEFNDVRAMSKLKLLHAVVFTEGCSYRARLSRALDRLDVSYNFLVINSLEAMRASLVGMPSVTLLPKAILATTWKGERLCAHTLPEAERFVDTSFVSGRWAQHNVTLQSFIQMTQVAFSQVELPDGRLIMPLDGDHLKNVS